MILSTPLHGQSLIADDQTALRTLGNEYTGSMIGLSTISWPFSRTDADHQFNFDLPFTAENIDCPAGANSTSLTNLDIILFFNGASRTAEPAESPGELIRFLSPNDKVKTSARARRK
jgi:hypothetical protein